MKEQSVSCHRENRFFKEKYVFFKPDWSVLS